MNTSSINNSYILDRFKDYAHYVDDVYGLTFDYKVDFPSAISDMVQHSYLRNIPMIKDTMYNPPATIVWFDDGSKIVSKCDKIDTFSKEIGFMTCLLKKYLGKKEFYKLMEKYVYGEE